MTPEEVLLGCRILVLEEFVWTGACFVDGLVVVVLVGRYLLRVSRTLRGLHFQSPWIEYRLNIG